MTRRAHPVRSRLTAHHLLDEWTRLSHDHVPAHGGCSCGAGLAHVRIADFEQDILDYLVSKYARAGQQEALAIARTAQGAGIAGLLDALSDREESQSAQLVLIDLKRSIDSFHQLHRFQ
jgi:hypothetical protein